MIPNVIFGIIVLCVMTIPLTVGIIIYKDAKSRGMDALLWTLIAMLVPSFIGVIIYLVVRQGYLPNTSSSCPSCGKLVKRDWKNCPHCGFSLPQEADMTVAAPKSSSKGLFILLGLQVLIPVVIIIIQIIIVYS